MSAPTANADRGLAHLPSRHSVAQTIDRAIALIAARGLTLFAEIDHGGEAAKVGLTMRPTRLLIFGDPRAGTPLMQAAPSIAIDLPLKLLVWEDDHGAVWVSCNTATYLQERHGFPIDLVHNIAGVEALAATIAEG